MNRQARAGSPCISVCKLVDLEGDDVCCGCGRTLEEIAQWPDAGYERRQEILEAASARRLAMLSRRA
ncbi:DUF1289 domain-containing protein [Ectothiorhodospiraceae bacterium WFHF3C12]|nr:DUF1289 domain-containing protein [Ectothiorhodospiraceae bacterium WFHF3C12]